MACHWERPHREGRQLEGHADRTDETAAQGHLPRAALRGAPTSAPSLGNASSATGALRTSRAHSTNAMASLINKYASNQVEQRSFPVYVMRALDASEQRILCSKKKQTNNQKKRIQTDPGDLQDRFHLIQAQPSTKQVYGHQALLSHDGECLQQSSTLSQRLKEATQSLFFPAAGIELS